jgi:hypothetical protein
LYLGRDFELKRKDYLYDDLNMPRTVTLENIIRSLEELRTQIVDIKASRGYRTTDAERAFAVLSGSVAEEANFDEFDKYFSEVINAIEVFIADEADNELTREVENIFQSDDRQYRAEALLISFRKYQLAKV